MDIASHDDPTNYLLIAAQLFGESQSHKTDSLQPAQPTTDHNSFPTKESWSGNTHLEYPQTGGSIGTPKFGLYRFAEGADMIFRALQSTFMVRVHLRQPTNCTTIL